MGVVVTEVRTDDEIKVSIAIILDFILLNRNYQNKTIKYLP